MKMKQAHRVSILKLLGWLAVPGFLSALLLLGGIESQAKRYNTTSTELPAALILWPESNSPYAVFVDKANQKVLVYRTDDLSRPVKTFICSTGENIGPKTRQNDKKTPEGVYFFTDIFKERDLTPIYGPRAYPVDYPNPLDHREGKDGYGIWFHGTNKPLKPNDTNGCIVLENGDIEALGEYIRPYDTPTIIASRLEMIDPVQLDKTRLSLELFVEGWRASWEEKRIDDYISFYGDAFFDGDKDRESFREYKAGLAEKYDWISVDIDNLRLLGHNGTVLAKFNQHYRSEGFDSQGEKRLYIRKNQGEWKIVDEHFTASEERVLVAGKPETEPVPSPSAVILDFIARWESAWESQDLKTYIACYDTSFHSRGMDLKAWKRHRERLNRKQDLIRVEISEPDINLLDNTRARVTFKQDYRADDYRDFGLKELLLIKRGEQWKIKSEEWQELDRSAP